MFLTNKHKLHAANARPYSQLSRGLLAFFFICLSAQVLFQKQFSQPGWSIRDLATAPDEGSLRVMSLGDPISLSKLVMLNLQAIDFQPGVSLSFRDLDYVKLTVWLDRALSLDPLGTYPLLSAVRVYAEVQDTDRQRQMLRFVEAKFKENPNLRWPWMAQAVFVARHRLQDMDYALQLADQMAQQITDLTVPSWTTQMGIFLREDLGELESAEALLGALLESGQVQDAHEQQFLHQRLDAMKAQRAAASARQLKR